MSDGYFEILFKGIIIAYVGAILFACSVLMWMNI